MKIPYLFFREKRTGVWIASRCKSTSLRERIISELVKKLDIDIYGNCGRKKCQVPKGVALTGVDCRIQIQNKYKFYFAFENSICQDYVTEKFFDTALTGMVPVVFGGADYRAMFPSMSFINVMDYNSVDDLANYLNYLSRNPTEWLKYFEWRKDFWVQTNRFVTGYCALCQKLRDLDEGSRGQRFYPSVADWWVYGGFNTKGISRPLCSSPKSR